MPRLSFLTMVEIVAGLSIAGPLFLFGLEHLLAGETAFAGVMLVLAVVGTFFPSFFLHRFLGRRTVVGRLLEALPLPGGSTGGRADEDDLVEESR